MSTISLIDVVAILGLIGVYWQTRQANRSTVANALLSGIASRWQLIENVKYKMRVEKPEISDLRIEDFLDTILEEQFGNLPDFANAFGIDRIRWEAGDNDQKTVKFEILREYRIRDLLFNLCEEEYVAHWLKFVDDRLWRYWRWYLDRTFEKDKCTYYYWRIRREFGTTHEAFVNFVESRYYREQSGSPEGCSGKGTGVVGEEDRGDG